MAERTIYYVTEGDFVSGIPHPFNQVLDAKPHLERPFQRILESYGQGNFEAIEEALVLSYVAFIDNPRNVPIFAEAYRTTPDTVNRWLSEVDEKPHLQEVVEEAIAKPRQRLKLTEGKLAYKQQVFDEYFQDTLATIPEDLLTDIERLVYEHTEQGFSANEFAAQYNYKPHSVKVILMRVRSKLEEKVLLPSGIKRATSYDGRVIEDAAREMSRRPRIVARKFLNLWYTMDTYAENYINEGSRLLDPDLLEEGYVWLGDRDIISKKESMKLLTKEKYQPYLMRKRGRVYMLPEDLTRIRAEWQGSDTLSLPQREEIFIQESIAAD